MNLHVPKGTSPSSYSASPSKNRTHNDLAVHPTTSGALGGDDNSEKCIHPSPNHPTDLAEVIVAWEHLPEHIKAAIKALVQSCIKEHDDE